MKNEKKSKKNKNVSESTRQLIDVSRLDDISMITLNNEHLVFLEVQPINVAVIGNSRVLGYVSSLQNVLEHIGDVEIICLSSAQSYEQNKRYLKERSNISDMHPEVRKLCLEDIEFLDNISLTMSTSRSFFFVVRFKRVGKDNIEHKLLQYQTIIREQGFTIKRTNKTDLKKMLAIYWEQNTHLDDYPDFDGEQFLKGANA